MPARARAGDHSRYTSRDSANLHVNIQLTERHSRARVCVNIAPRNRPERVTLYNSEVTADGGAHCRPTSATCEPSHAGIRQRDIQTARTRSKLRQLAAYSLKITYAVSSF